MDFSVEYDSSQPGRSLPTPWGARWACGGLRLHQPPFRSPQKDNRAHVEAIRDFISVVDPVTGYIEDADEDGEDDVDDE